MAFTFLFADETGNFDPAPRHGATRWFGVGTVALDASAVAPLRSALHDLRTTLAWQRLHLDGGTHAHLDPWPVREAVLGELARHPIRADVSLFDKHRIGPDLVPLDTGIYRAVWAEHLRTLLPRICTPGDDLMVVVAEIGTQRRRAVFRAAVEDALAVHAVSLRRSAVSFWPAVSDPCLWAADYCAWAVARKWERGDESAWRLIRQRIATESAVQAAPELQSAPPN